MPDWTDTYLTATEAQTAVHGARSFSPFAWIAKITGLHKEFNFQRTFLHGHRRLRPCPDGSGHLCGTIHWRIPGPGVYEYRGFVTGLVGEHDADSGFFEVTATGLGRYLWEHQVTSMVTDFDALEREWEAIVERDRSIPDWVPHKRRDRYRSLDGSGHYH